MINESEKQSGGILSEAARRNEGNWRRTAWKSQASKPEEGENFWNQKKKSVSAKNEEKAVSMWRKLRPEAGYSSQLSLKENISKISESILALKLYLKRIVAVQPAVMTKYLAAKKARNRAGWRMKAASACCRNESTWRNKIEAWRNLEGESHPGEDYFSLWKLM